MLVHKSELHTLTRLAPSPLASTFRVESKARAKSWLVLAIQDFTIVYELNDHNLMVESWEQEAKYSLLMTAKDFIISVCPVKL